MSKTILTILSVAALMFLAVPAGADDITDELEDAIARYEAGDIAGALDAVNLAEAWLLERQAEGLTTIFPEIEGWKRDVGEGSAAAAGYGGGVSASCDYENDEGIVEVNVISNSPMMGMVNTMLSNSMMASASGMKVVKVAGQKAALKNENGTVKVMIPYGGTVLVEVSTDTSKDNAMFIAEQLDWEKLGTISRAQ